MNAFETQHRLVNAAEINPAAFNLDDRKAILAMQATRLFVDGDPGFETANYELQEVAALAGEPPTMTYKDVIFTNNFFGFTRVISTDPEAALNEARFYRAHREIEHHLYGTIDRLLGTEPEPDTTAVEELGLAVKGIAGLYRSLDAAAFAAFRPYFVGLNGYPGASGLYSESIPILDLLVHGGSNIGPDERAQMFRTIDSGLYPRQGKPGDPHRYGNLHRELLLTDNPALDLPENERQELTRHLDAFRGVHRNSVKKFVPGALEGLADGSGGVQDVGAFLDSKRLSGSQARLS